MTSKRFATDSSENEGTEALLIGDLICLYDDERQGYVMNYQSSCAHNDMVIAPDQSKEYPIIPNIQTIQFEICIPHRYKCNKVVPRIKSLLDNTTDDISLRTKYENAKKLAEGENTDNWNEQMRQCGKQVVLYGQTVQLRHAFTRKWMHVNPIQTALTEPSSMTVELRPELSKTAYFKVLPCSKVKSEGEQVHINDRIVFESVKTPGQYLHSSRLTLGPKYVCSDCHELNISVRQSSYSVFLSHRPVVQSINHTFDPQLSAVTGGTFFRLYHREAEAYLAQEGIDENTGEDAHLHIRRFDATIPKTMQPSTSAINYWQIEKETGPLDCDKIKWDEFVKLRHAISRQYLCVREGHVRTTADMADDDIMLFKLVPVVKRTDYLSMETTVRIQHAESKLWLRGGSDRPYVTRSSRRKGMQQSAKNSASSSNVLEDMNGTASIQWTTAERFQIVTSKDMRYDDAFSLQIVAPNNLWEMNFVAGMVPFLHKLCSDISQGFVSNLSARILVKIETAVHELELFLFVDDVPCKRRQKLLRNFMIVDVGVQLLRLRTQLLSGQVTLPGHDSRATSVLVHTCLEPVFAAIIRMLSAYVTGESRKNELYLGRHMDFFISQIDNAQSVIGLTSTQLAMELLGNNRKLVDRFTKQQIDKIILLVKRDVNYRHLGLLCALCECGGAALTRTQDYVANNLIAKPIANDQNIFLLTDLGQNIGRRRNAVYVSWDQGRGWQVLHDFTTQSWNTDHYMFLKNQLKLFSALCKGRNANVSRMISTELGLINWQQCYICLTDSKLSDEIRAIYCELMYELFINIGTNFIQSQDMKIVFVYDKIISINMGKRKLQPNSDSKALPFEFMEPLKSWINTFLIENDSLVASDSGRNELVTQVLNLVPKLVRLGYYVDKEIKSVLLPIFGLLEGSDDLPYRVANVSKAPDEIRQLIEKYRREGRFMHNTLNTQLVPVKIGACHATELFFNLRSSVRLNRFLSNFKEINAREDTRNRHKLGAMLYDDFDLTDRDKCEHSIAMVKDIFKESDYLEDIDFVQCMVDLCHYEFPQLVSDAMYLLRRYHSSFEDLLGFASQTQLLATERSCQVLDYVNTNLRELRLMLADGNIDAENSDRMKELLESFSLLCYLDGDSYNECHPINQQLLYNSGVLGDIFDIITGQVDIEHESLSQVYYACFVLLRAMSRSNEVVQHRLFDRMSTFFKVEGAEDYLSELFVEIFTGNKALCQRIPSKMVMNIVAELARTRNPTLIRLLTSLVRTEHNVPIKRNQQLVVKALLQYKQSIELVTDTPADQILAIMATDERKNAKIANDQKYLANIIQLLAYCSQGDNATVESICQSMFTLHQLLQIILLPTLCDGMRAPFVQFLIAVFFTSDLEIATFELKEMSHEPKLWSYIDNMSATIKRCTDDVQRDMLITRNHLKRRPTLAHISLDNIDHEIKETLHYIFDGVLPFLQIFYKSFFQRFDDNSSVEDSVSVDQRAAMMSELILAEHTITTRLLRNALIPFVVAVHPCLTDSNHLTALRNAISAIIESTGITEQMPMILTQPLKPLSKDPLNRYQTYYADEQILNQQLCAFVDNVKLAYAGANTVKAQIGAPSLETYTETDDDIALPLGREFQRLVHSFAKKSQWETQAERWDNISCVVSYVSQYRHQVISLERDIIRAEVLVVRALQLIRTVLHNEIVRLPKVGTCKARLIEEQLQTIAELQNAMVDMNLCQGLVTLLGSPSDEITKETLAIMVDLLYGGNSYVQDKLLEIFEQLRDEPFFEAVKWRMLMTEEVLRERRLLAASMKMKKRKKTVAALEAEPAKAMIESLKMDLADLQEYSNERNNKQTVSNQKRSLFFRALSKDPKEDKTAAKAMHDQRNHPSRQSKKSVRHDIMFSKQVNLKLQDQPFDIEYEPGMKMSPIIKNEHDKLQDEGHLVLVLRVLSAMCDGQNERMQDYMHNQWDNPKTIDLVGDTCDFLPWLLSGQITNQTITVVIQLVSTIIEMVQGNETNQVTAFDHKVLDHVLPVLHMTCFPGCSLLQIYELKRMIGILLIDMVEENSESGHTKTIMDSCSKNDIADQMLEAYALMDDRELMLDSEIENLVISVGFTFHHLLCRAFDLDASLPREQWAETEAFEYFMAHTMSVEIQKKNTLQRVYFTVEEVNVLRRAVKERAKWEIDRSSPSNKLRDFMAWSREICDDIRYQRKVQSYGLCRWLVNNWSLLNISMLLLTFIINLVVLFGWMAPEKFNSDYEYSVLEGEFWPVVSSQVQQLIYILGGLHTIICVTVTASFLLANRPTVPVWMKKVYAAVRSKMKKKTIAKKKTDEEEVNQNAYLSIDLFSSSGLYYPAITAISILATYQYGAWFCFIMLHIVNQNQLLRRAIQAITLNGRSMLWVCFLGGIWLYIFTLIGFLFLRNIFTGNQLYCTTLWECFVSTIRNGLMFGMADNFDIPDEDANNEFSYYGLKAIYDLAFFALITTIGLNMIFGIIIDTFSQLREAKFQIEQDMINQCFICNRPSYEFEQHARGFRHHVKVEHNMWAYLFFFIHLGDRPANDLSSLELHVHRQIKEEGWEFFPQGKALSLQHFEDESSEKKQITKLIEQVNFLVKHIKGEEQKKDRVAAEAARDAKRQQQRSRTKWYQRKRRESTISRTAHGTYGPYMATLHSA